MIQRILRLLSPKKNEWTKAFDLSARIEKALIALYGEDVIKAVKAQAFVTLAVSENVDGKPVLLGHIVYDTFVTAKGKTERLFFVSTTDHSVLFAREPVEVDAELLERVLSALAPPDEAE